MRILAVNTVMNPKFNFYAKLLKFIKNAGVVMTSLAEEIVEIYDVNKEQISLEDVTLENLLRWHEEINDQNLGGEDPGIEQVEIIAECAFKDFAPQMRSKAVRDLFQKWKSVAGLIDDTDVFIHVRKLKGLGDEVAALTVLTDDTDLFRRFLQEPDGEWYTHYSESDEVKDPQ